MKKSQFVILLAVIVLGFGGIFGYVKYRLDNEKQLDNNKTEEKSGQNGNKTETELLTEVKVQEYLSLVPFRAAAYNIKDAYSGKTTYKNDVKELLLNNALINGTSFDEVCRTNNLDDMGDYWSYKISDMNNRLAKYNTSVSELNINEFYPEEDILVKKVNNDTYCKYLPGRGASYLKKSTISFTYEQKDDTLIISEKALFTHFSEVPDKVYQTTSNNAISIYTFIIDFDDYDNVFNSKITELSDKAYTFKHTFKKMSNGEYYWYSTEVI